MREVTLARKTKETDIELTLNLDGTGQYSIESGNGFFNHMLEIFAKHGRFDLKLSCNGDTDVDFHHSAEDIGIVLGSAFKEALGDCAGICRYGTKILPMDEALILAAVDICGRATLICELDVPAPQIGTFDSELVKEFMTAFSRNMAISLHLRKITGENSHHIIEGAFKALAQALKDAVAIDEKYKDEIPSTKGIL